MADYYYLNPDKDLSTISGAALAKLDNDSDFPQISADVTEALFQALQKKQVFGIFAVRQNDSVWQSLQLDSGSGWEPSQTQNDMFGRRVTYTLEQLHAIHETLKCDAVLIGTVTAFKPYPHMTIGLRLKLVDLRDGQLLWALEQIWDTTDKTTEDRIKKYYSHHIFSSSAALQEKLGTISPLKFIKFVVYEVAETLQPER